MIYCSSSSRCQRSWIKFVFNSEKRILVDTCSWQLKPFVHKWIFRNWIASQTYVLSYLLFERVTWWLQVEHHRFACLSLLSLATGWQPTVLKRLKRLTCARSGKLLSIPKKILPNFHARLFEIVCSLILCRSHLQHGCILHNVKTRPSLERVEIFSKFYPDIYYIEIISMQSIFRGTLSSKLKLMIRLEKTSSNKRQFVTRQSTIKCSKSIFSRQPLPWSSMLKKCHYQYIRIIF